MTASKCQFDTKYRHLHSYHISSYICFVNYLDSETETKYRDNTRNKLLSYGYYT